MFDSLARFGHALWGLMTPYTLFNAVWATFMGIVIGALPGLTATMGVALFTTLTPASACSTLDGYPLARQGLAGRAMGISTSGSWLGTLFGILCVAAFTPILGEMALSFGSYEFFWIAVYGIVIAGTLSGGDALKGYIAGFLGLLVATVGREPYYNFPRFAFDSTDLSGGIGLLPALVGVFGVSEVLLAMRRPAVKAIVDKLDSVIPRVGDVLQYWRTIIRSGFIGVIIGILPGLGEDAAAWSSYAAAKRASKEREKFGKGSIEGLMAAETGEASSVPGAIIPVLTLAIPGSAPAAVLMAAMMVHGMNPGPMLMIDQPTFLHEMVAMLLIADMVKLVFGFILVRPLIKILLVPRERLMPVVFVLCVVGAFAITSQVFDIYVMLVFGLIGFVLRELKFPMAPLVLGLVLGDLLEKNLTRGLVLSAGDVAPFFTRPLCAALVLATAATILWSIPGVSERIGALLGGRRA